MRQTTPYQTPAAVAAYRDDLAARCSLTDGAEDPAQSRVVTTRRHDPEALLVEALGHFTSAREVVRQAECLEALGEIAEQRRGDPNLAIRCYERARQLAIAADDRALSERLARRLDAIATHGDVQRAAS